MRCVGNGTADRAYSSQPLRSHTAPPHAHAHSPRTPPRSGRHTHSLTHKDTHSETHKETLTDSGIFKYRDALIDRDMATMTPSTEARAESHSNTDTLKYSRQSQQGRAQICGHMRSVRHSATRGQGSAGPPGWEGGRVRARAHTTAPLSAANVQKFTADRRTQTFSQPLALTSGSI